MCSQIRRNVKRKTYEIGVLKGIGLKNKYVFEMFFSQMLTLILAIFTFSTISIIFTDSIINDMLINNIEISFPGNLKEELVFFSYRSIDILIIYSLIIMIGLLTTIILISSLKKIKPINIIKAAND